VPFKLSATRLITSAFGGDSPIDAPVMQNALKALP
jgi:hypothetical protein